MSISERQIIRQILGQTIVRIYFHDFTNDFVELTESQLNDAPIITLRPAFSSTIFQLTEDQLDQLKERFTNEQTYNTDPEIVRTNLTRQEFYQQYRVYDPRYPISSKS